MPSIKAVSKIDFPFKVDQREVKKTCKRIICTLLPADR